MFVQNHTGSDSSLFQQDTGTYRYGFNGQEKDNEIAGQGNAYTAMFWEYDPRSGRRWNRDPVVKPWGSPYLTFGGNPIWFSDLLGNTWDPSNNSKEKANKFRGRTNDQISAVNNTISSVTEQMKGFDQSSNEYATLNGQLTNLNDRLSELNSTISDLDALENSDQVYQLKPIWQDPNSKILTASGNKFKDAGLGGKTYYKKDVVVMEYGLGDLNTQAHELKHGFQFETRLLSFDNSNGGNGGWLYDLTDEQAATKRGSAFSGSLTSPILNVSFDDLIELGYSRPSVNLNAQTPYKDVYKAYTGTDISDPTYNRPFIDFIDSYPNEIIKR